MLSDLEQTLEISPSKAAKLVSVLNAKSVALKIETISVVRIGFFEHTSQHNTD